MLYSAAAAESVIAAPARSFYTNLLRPRGFRRRADAEFVSSVYRAVQWRTTSRLSDETLALGLILNVNDARLADFHGDERMELLLRNLPEIPAGLIFMPGQRLKNSPFRWAPRTWMIGDNPRYPDPFVNPISTYLPTGYSMTLAQSVLTDRGLLVRYPGYRLRGARSIRFDFDFPTDLTLRRWYQVRRLFPGIVTDLTLEKKQSIKLGIICCRPNAGVLPEIAVLVFIEGESNGTLHSRWLDLVRINLLDQDDDILRAQKRFMAENAQCVPGETLSPEQLWTVD